MFDNILKKLICAIFKDGLMDLKCITIQRSNRFQIVYKMNSKIVQILHDNLTNFKKQQ